MILSRELEDVIREAACNSGFSIRSDYSGRGMFGRECFGVVADASVGKFVATILRYIDDSDILEELSRLLEDMRTDSMGLSTIFYFPNWELEETDGDDWD